MKVSTGGAKPVLFVTMELQMPQDVVQPLLDQCSQHSAVAQPCVLQELSIV